MSLMVRILGTGKYLPSKIVTSEEIDKKLGLSIGWTEKKSGVKKRHYIENETASEMGAKAATQALQNAGLQLDDIDLIVSASGTMQQPIPCNASLIHEQLKPTGPIPAFDINSTCLSFVTGFDVISHLIPNQTYKNVLLVSSEISSVGINPKQKESYVLFGDAAAACVLSITKEGETSKILGSKMVTYSEGAHLTEIRGGGTNIHPNYNKVEDNYLFDMDGRAVFRLSSRHINMFVEELLQNANVRMEDINLVIPHQASGMAMKLMRKKLNIDESRFMNVIEKYGNTIASSIPLALHDSIEGGRLKRGDIGMFLGTSAGLSIGGVIFEY